MEGFILKCKKCGKETELMGERFYLNHLIDAEGLEMEINWGREEIEIKCECGNTAFND